MADSYTILSLSSLIKNNSFEAIQNIINSFNSVQKSDTEIFLKMKAIEMEIRDICRTFVAFSNDGVILGYVTIAIKCFRVPDNNMLSKKTIKRMNIESRVEDGFKVAQAYLIGQLSRSKDAPKGLGKELLDVAFDKLGCAKDLVGCRVVRLDCHDELISYYANHDFNLIKKNEGNTLNQMVAFI